MQSLCRRNDHYVKPSKLNNIMLNVRVTTTLQQAATNTETDRQWEMQGRFHDDWPTALRWRVCNVRLVFVWLASLVSHFNPPFPLWWGVWVETNGPQAVWALMFVRREATLEVVRVWQLLAAAKKSVYLAVCQRPSVQLWRLPSLCWWSWSCGWLSLHQPLKELPENRVKHAKYATSFSLYMLLLAFTIIHKHSSRIFREHSLKPGGGSLATQSSKALDIPKMLEWIRNGNYPKHL